jgi:hypothetical protein
VAVGIGRALLLFGIIGAGIGCCWSSVTEGAATSNAGIPDGIMIPFAGWIISILSILLLAVVNSTLAHGFDSNQSINYGMAMAGHYDEVEQESTMLMMLADDEKTKTQTHISYSCARDLANTNITIRNASGDLANANIKMLEKWVRSGIVNIVQVVKGPHQGVVGRMMRGGEHFSEASEARPQASEMLRINTR